MNDFGELVEFDGALYRAVLAEPNRAVAEYAQRLETSADAIEKSAARLGEMGLLRIGASDRISAVSPMLAEATVLGAEDLELAARRAAVEQRRDSIRQLIPDWNTALSERVSDGAVDVISDPTAMANVFMHYADYCSEELLSIAPGRMAATRIDGRTRMANVYSSRRGIKTRAIYQYVALKDRATRSYLNELAQNGARVRLTPSVPGRGLVIDREVALLPIPTEESGGQRLAVVRERNVIAWVIATFEQLWAEASPLDEVMNNEANEHGDSTDSTDSNDRTDLDQTRAAILRLMAEGEKDEAISRRLSISVRTCRRHIADYMLQVGASSRFQAGVIAARAGHTDAPTPS
ncbi:helix-turn-helix domain-containing protein [uncultured Jatrophihabitans sp.]|uniref:helix-turn-helix transcriptional regulator n=1 Tax=uncultured Jatrophihabitans sp. TaxID=1610747 RepID=UPI0035C9F4FD